MKRLFFVLFGAAFVLGACGGADEPAPAPEQEITGDFDPVRAESAYQLCVNCHGANLQGAPAYPHPITGLTKEEVLAAIEDGPGVMPGNMVRDEEAENLASWIAAQE
ncbi:hypothetical protein BKP45_07370 [Anaerobacillus alkalidiazotrophicus]|uniref:Cytochrome c domain-containing protein n=1 Tax=Anaerobacillus alkalidiazotrophicus TaxID=472963 RepID=A0A1S2M8S5_9BACI|nr:cytochrome c [Anaerobacillus alkalidiazotrophicus]OIJ21004.1 hypothetical protein BKP45_07370 [Anaerobacillus alkalidiazotrophicus]